MCKRCLVASVVTLLALASLVLMLSEPSASRAAVEQDRSNPGGPGLQQVGTPSPTVTRTPTPGPGSGGERVIICVGNACADGVGAGMVLLALVVGGAIVGYYVCRQTSSPNGPIEGGPRQRG